MKLNRRTRWKYAKSYVLELFDKDFASPASFGPAGRHHSFFFGGVDPDVTISASSKQKYWERLHRWIQSIDPQRKYVLGEQRRAIVALWDKPCPNCAMRYGSHNRVRAVACGIWEELKEWS